MAMSPFLSRLAEGPLLCDGAMGTMLYASGVPLDGCFDVFNANNPTLVQSIHAAYLSAGADLIETNTFGANRFKLAVHGLDARVREINARGAKLARDVRETAGREAFVLGSIGPLGKYLAPIGAIGVEEGRAAFREQAEGLLEGGVDAFIVETFSDLGEIRLAVEAIRALTDELPIIAQMAFTDEGVTFVGRSAVEVARALRGLPVQVIGANCSVGSSVLYDILEQMLPEAGGLPISIQPNAGLPSRVGERLIYLSSPAYMAEYAGKMLEAGARIVGGCCGTTPDHIRAMRAAVDRHVPTRARAGRVTVSPPAREEAPALRTTAVPTPLARKLEAGEFLVTVELDPPRGHNIEKLVQGAKLLKERGVEMVDINDGSLGRIRMSVLPTAVLVREATGLDIIMHFTCRDRNLMGIQADLLGAHAMGIRNILAIKGDPPRAGDYVNATAIFDVNAIGLIRIIQGMNGGLDATGNSIGEPTGFHVGAGLNPAALDPDKELARLFRKVEAGARWAQTQPVYDLEVLDRFLSRAGRLPIPIIVGLLPLHSFRHAEFLHNEVPGITIPDAVRARMKEAGDRALRQGIEMAQALLQQIRARYAGAYLMPSFGRYEVVAEVLDALR
ncbi:MAG: bifunctional homocysteine S-methyltransferase/methylenetetrahydrofolate reductase [Candidatus Rokubacteria bacterium RIFCSPHIGHO2_02_FULL_69_13]|nr:MAG: bifunctional homocysteine S-methyltransferase/methylenetetrahydrofolate reductase [Candidatus Rokubacteria bacterium RIFCSPHIGHO2_02_FULL_69_13]